MINIIKYLEEQLIPRVVIIAINKPGI